MSERPRSARQPNTQPLSFMLAITPASPLTLRLYMPRRGTQERLIADLLYMQSDGNYTWLIWRNGERVLLPRTMKYLESKLPAEQFVRIHRQFSINIQHIEGVEWAPNQLTVRLSNDERLLVSRRKRTAVRTRLWHHLKLSWS